MQLPIISVAPIVWEHTLKFRSVFANRKQFRHFENYVTDLITLDDKAWPTWPTVFSIVQIKPTIALSE